MTQKISYSGPKIALYQPDIPQNTAAIIRTCSCLGVRLEIIEPCGFFLSDSRFKRVVMDYMDTKQIKFYKNYDEFLNSKPEYLVKQGKLNEQNVSLYNIKIEHYNPQCVEMINAASLGIQLNNVNLRSAIKLGRLFTEKTGLILSLIHI